MFPGCRERVYWEQYINNNIKSEINLHSKPSRSMHFRKLNLNFYFRISLWYLKRFYEGSLRPS